MDPDRAPSPAVRLWPDAARGPWAVVTHWTAIDGRAECVGIEVRSFRHDGETDNPWRQLPLQYETTGTVTTSLVRGIPIAQVISDTRRAEAAGFQFDVPEQRDEAWAAERRVWQGLSRYEEAARIYSEAYKAGRSPTRAVARYFQISYAAAAKLVVRARQHGLLPPTTPGRASGPARKDQP